ncbi:MAG: ATP-binding protein [Lachnospiraceae bacterium]|nr:ATP-binding protein [Lachnospiraceae bacterium]
MKIAVLSGKGGTGKTTVSTNIALNLRISYVDSDVEEPNGFIFLKPEIVEKQEVRVEYPVIDPIKCTLCGECVKACQFNALASTGKEILVFEKLCHDCGACKIVCKQNALDYQPRATGQIEKGYSNGLFCQRGILNVGEPMAVPIIRKLLQGLDNLDCLIDCPPGTSCNVVNVLKYADAAVLVTEPSQFGLHDLKMAVELVRLYHIPFGIIINKDNERDNIIKQFCKEDSIPLLGCVPYRMEAATLYSNGRLLSEDTFYQSVFNEISLQMKEVFSWK